MHPSVHLAHPHELDPSVLGYIHPDGNGDPSWMTDPNDRSQFDCNFDEFGDYVDRTVQILNILMINPKLHQLITCGLKTML